MRARDVNPRPGGTRARGGKGIQTRVPVPIPGHSRESLATAARSDGSASPLLRVATQRASYSSLAPEQCLALQVFPSEPAQQLAIPLESHAVEVPRDRGFGSEGSKAANYLMLEYFEGPQLLGLDIASDLSLNRCHSSAPPPRIIDRQPVVCHIDCCRDIGTYVSKELALKESAGVGAMMSANQPLQRTDCAGPLGMGVGLSTIISFWSTGFGLRKVSICHELLRPTTAGL